MDSIFCHIDTDTEQPKSGPLVAHRCCPVCGGDDPSVVESIEDLQFFSDPVDSPKRTTVTQVQCGTCLALYMNPAYTMLGFETLFREAGRSYGDGGGRHDEQIAWLRSHNLVSASQTYMDIGCYEGHFLASLPEGKHFYGIDFDAPAIERARANFDPGKFTFFQGRFEELSMTSRVDVFTMFHVLEHLVDPGEVLRRLRALSHEKTALVIEIPILEQGETNDIHGFFSPQHLTHFSKHTLAMLLAQSGWRLADEESAPDYNGYRILAFPAEAGCSVTANPEDRVSLQRVLDANMKACTAVNAKVDHLPTDKNWVIWGAGMHLEMLYQRTNLFKKLDGAAAAVVDGDPMKQGTRWRGFHIHAPDRLKELDWGETILIISSYGSQEKIVAAAMALGVPENQIFRCYDTVMTY